MQEVWATLDREEVVALGLFSGVPEAVYSSDRVGCTLLMVLSVVHSQNRVGNQAAPKGMSSSCAQSMLVAGGELQDVRSCTHSDLSTEGLTVLLFSSTDPQKEVCPQRPL